MIGEIQPNQTVLGTSENIKNYVIVIAILLLIILILTILTTHIIKFVKENKKQNKTLDLNKLIQKNYDFLKIYHNEFINGWVENKNKYEIIKQEFKDNLIHLWVIDKESNKQYELWVKSNWN